MSTNHELEQRIKRLETLLGRGVEHLSLEPDGTLMIDSLRYDTPQNAGYITDQFGNFHHSRSATGDSWSIVNNANSAMLTFYWETGNLDIKGNLGVSGDLTVGGKMLVDIFYPVGTYYETSDANFNPNTAWGGTWGKAITDLDEYRKVLWTSNTYTDFAAQTISMNLSNYTFVEVEFYASSNTDIFVPNALKIRIGENGSVILMHNLKGNGTNENTGARRINVSTNGVTFTDYTYKNRRTGGTLTVANQFCVPRRIYGIKEITEYRWHRTA